MPGSDRMISLGVGALHSDLVRLFVVDSGVCRPWAASGSCHNEYEFARS